MVRHPTILSHTAVHRNDPQTISYALADSPVGTAAWILGRRHDWSDHGGDVYSVFDRDFLCTTASIYWLNGSVATSMRFYRDQYAGGLAPQPQHGGEQVITVPTAFTIFPKDLLPIPRAMAESRTNLHRFSIMPQGGHFAPSERPLVVVQELREFYRTLS